MGRIHGRSKLAGSALSSRVAQWTQAGLIKAIQPFAITIAAASATGTATLAAVSTKDTVLIFEGQTYDAIDTDTASSFARFVLTNSTTVTATRVATNNNMTVTGMAVEFVPGIIKSIQNFTIAVAGATSNTATITTINTLKTILVPMGASTNDVSGSAATWMAGLTLTNATTVTATRASASAVTTTFAGQAVELF